MAEFRLAFFSGLLKKIQLFFSFHLFPSDTDHSLRVPSRCSNFLTLHLRIPPITLLPTSLENLQTQIHDFLSVSSLSSSFQVLLKFTSCVPWKVFFLRLLKLSSHVLCLFLNYFINQIR